MEDEEFYIDTMAAHAMNGILSNFSDEMTYDHMKLIARHAYNIAFAMADERKSRYALTHTTQRPASDVGPEADPEPR